MNSEPSTAPVCEVRLRIYHEFEKPRSGRELILKVASNPEPNEGDQRAILPQVPVSTIEAAIHQQFGSSSYIPHVYDHIAECFVPLHSLPSPMQTADPPASTKSLPRIDVKLVPSQPPEKPCASPAQIADRIICDSSNTPLTASWFGIGILRGKTAANHGTLWRSALQFGASMTFTIGRRYERRVEGCADVYKTLRQIPCLPYPDVATFMAGCPIDAQIVVIEYGGVDLSHFVHPKRAVYILGSEDCGIPPALVARAQWHIAVPTADDRPSSLNVAATGAIVMYDRFVKLSRARQQVTTYDRKYDNVTVDEKP